MLDSVVRLAMKEMKKRRRLSCKDSIFMLNYEKGFS